MVTSPVFMVLPMVTLYCMVVLKFRLNGSVFGRSLTVPMTSRGRGTVVRSTQVKSPGRVGSPRCRVRKR